jgi:hypothetical protein
VYNNKEDAMRRIEAVSMLVLFAAVMAGSMVVWGEDAPKTTFRYGADERIREEYFDNIPIKAPPPNDIARGGENNYFRFRTRVWTEFDPAEKVTLRLRAVNEFRQWDKPATPTLQKSSYEFPDEVVLDALSVEIRDLMNDKLDLKVGRQDLIYGTGKVILEGTPKDGSRTIYFNAAKATWKGVKDTTIDVIGIYDKSLDDLAINDANRDLTGLDSNNDDMDESGVVLYLKNKSAPTFPFEVYGIYKNESDWDKISGSGTNAVTTAIDALDLGTVGCRLLPEFSERLKGNFELAGQYGSRGDQDVQGYMLDAIVTYAVPAIEDMKPAVDCGWYYLSGDDPDSSKDEGWNPLWARYPQYSDMYVYAYDADGAGRWSNLNMPHAGLSLSPAKWLKTTAMVAYLFAPEKDGPGGGDERGFLAVLKGEFTIGESLLMHKDKLAGHLQVEILEPGNYYNVNDTAVFARWELAYSF